MQFLSNNNRSITSSIARTLLAASTVLLVCSTSVLGSNAGGNGNGNSSGGSSSSSGSSSTSSSGSTGSSSSNGNGGGNGLPAGSYVGPLSNAKIGDSVTFYINSQQYKNACFTSLTEKNTNANWITNAIDESLGLQPKNSVDIPGVKVGDTIYLDNGVTGQKRLASNPQYQALLNAPVLYLPVMQGDPPYNQSRICVGFIAVHVTGVTINQSGGMVESLTCTILKGLASGTTGTIPSTGNTQTDSALVRLAPTGLKVTR